MISVLKVSSKVSAKNTRVTTINIMLVSVLLSSKRSNKLSGKMPI